MGDISAYTGQCRFCHTPIVIKSRIIERCMKTIKTVPIECRKCGKVTFYREIRGEDLIA